MRISRGLIISLAIAAVASAILVAKYFAVADQTPSDNAVETIYSQPSAIGIAVERITHGELGNLMKSEKALVVLDVRDRDAYAKEHIPGAKNIPVDELQARAINEISPASIIVINCGCPDAKLSEFASEILNEQGFSRISILAE